MTNSDYVFLGLFLTTAFVMGVPFFNLILTMLRVDLKWIKPSRFKDRESPIYRLIQGHFSGKFRVEKYYLDWSKLDFHSEKSPLKRSWIPFSGLFKYYRYVQAEEVFGSFEEDEVESVNLEEFWEGEFTKLMLQRGVEKNVANSFKLMLEDKNSKFNKNYVK